MIVSFGLLDLEKSTEIVDTSSKSFNIIDSNKLILV